MKKTIEEIIISKPGRNSYIDESGKRISYVEEKELIRNVKFPVVLVRIGHFVIDLIVCFALSYLALNLFYSFELGFRDENSKIILFFVIYILYYLFSEFLFQTTIGKAILGNVIINQYAEKPDFLSVIKRTFLRFFSLIFNILASTSLETNENHRLWHDIKSKTYVVSRKEANELKKLLNSL